MEDSDAANGRQFAEPELLPCPVPAAPGSRLSFSWGPGCQLHLAEVASPSTGAGGVQPYAGSCAWWVCCVTHRPHSNSGASAVAPADLCSCALF